LTNPILSDFQLQGFVELLRRSKARCDVGGFRSGTAITVSDCRRDRMTGSRWTMRQKNNAPDGDTKDEQQE
jgi:hypothetical protein